MNWISARACRIAYACMGSLLLLIAGCVASRGEMDATSLLAGTPGVGDPVLCRDIELALRVSKDKIDDTGVPRLLEAALKGSKQQIVLVKLSLPFGYIPMDRPAVSQEMLQEASISPVIVAVGVFEDCVRIATNASSPFYSYDWRTSKFSNAMAQISVHSDAFYMELCYLRDNEPAILDDILAPIFKPSAQQSESGETFDSCSVYWLRSWDGKRLEESLVVNPYLEYGSDRAIQLPLGSTIPEDMEEAVKKLMYVNELIRFAALKFAGLMDN